MNPFQIGVIITSLQEETRTSAEFYFNFLI